MNVLAIGCHPDDVEIACSGTLAKCVKRGDKVIVCHVSSGNLGHVIIPPDELTIIRENEAKKAAILIDTKQRGQDTRNDRAEQKERENVRRLVIKEFLHECKPHAR